MWNLLKEILDITTQKEAKGVIPILGVILGFLLFISPGYTLIFLYKRSLLMQDTVAINTVTILIINTLLFVVLFIIGAIRGIKEEKNATNEIGIVYDIVVTLILMGAISSVLLTVYAVTELIFGDKQLRVGIITISITLAIIIFKYQFLWRKVLSIKKEADKREKLLSEEIKKSCNETKSIEWK